jgi:hypothetical protein
MKDKIWIHTYFKSIQEIIQYLASGALWNKWPNNIGHSPKKFRHIFGRFFDQLNISG